MEFVASIVPTTTASMFTIIAAFFLSNRILKKRLSRANMHFNQKGKSFCG
jgi:hypothetical protein